MLGLFFISVLFQVFLPAANAVTLLRSPLTNDPNALCNDGSQAVYYHQQVGDDDGDGGGVPGSLLSSTLNRSVTLHRVDFR